MGFTEPCFSDSDEELCRQAYGEAVDFERLLKDGFAPLPVPDAPFAEGNFPTPSGKCEIHSARLAAQGLDPLPGYVPNHEAPGSSARYPLAMISEPARHRGPARAGDPPRRRGPARRPGRRPGARVQRPRQL
jgi:anaerobic selenocysteine-containing dehydrogenase